MNHKEKVPFDPKVFLAKVNGGGRTVSDYRKDQIVFRRGDPSDAVFYIQSGKVKKTVVSEQGKEAVVAVLAAGDFFGEGSLAGEALRLSTVSALTKCVIARISKAEITTRDPRRAGVCRVVYLAPLGPQRSYRRGPGRSTVQFQREASRADSSASGEFWQGGSTGADHSKSQPGDACRDDRNDSVPRKFLHE